MRYRTCLIGGLLLLAACEPDASSQPIEPDQTVIPFPETSQSHPDLTIRSFAPEAPLVRIEADAFVDRITGEPFVVRGANYFLIAGRPGAMRDRFFSPAVFDSIAVGDDFAELAGLGYNTVRLFLDSCSIGPDCITTAGEPGLESGYLNVIANVMRIAEANGLMLLLTSNDLPDGGGYRDIANRDNGAGFPGYRNSDFLTASGHEAMVEYWTDLVTELAERRAPFQVVLGWSILNEHWLFTDEYPLSLASGMVTTASGTYDMSVGTEKRAMVIESTRSLIASVATAIKSVSPEAHVTMGFFAPQFPNNTSIGGDWYVDTAPLVERSDLDFFDFHFYASSDIDAAEAAENFGIADTKPVIMGEYGAFVSDYPSPSNLGFVLGSHVSKSCDAGWDGWIYWGYLRAPFDDATWALTDQNGALLETFAPVHDPDPCDVVQNPNLASDAAITASQSLPDQPANRVADGLRSGWGAGAGPDQWIEIDLGGLNAIDTIELVVDQHPSGRTVHRVQWAGEDRLFNGGITFDSVTSTGDVLSQDWGFERQTMRYLRITTTVSPSWVAWQEINIFGTELP